MKGEIDFQELLVWVLAALFSFILMISLIINDYRHDALECISLNDTSNAGIVQDTSKGDVKPDCKSTRGVK